MILTAEETRAVELIRKMPIHGSSPMSDDLKELADDIGRQVANARSARDCPRCHGTGWWSRYYETGRDGCGLEGGPCDHRALRSRSKDNA